MMKRDSIEACVKQTIEVQYLDFKYLLTREDEKRSASGVPTTFSAAEVATIMKQQLKTLTTNLLINLAGIEDTMSINERALPAVPSEAAFQQEDRQKILAPPSILIPPGGFDELFSVVILRALTEGIGRDQFVSYEISTAQVSQQFIKARSSVGDVSGRGPAIVRRRYRDFEKLCTAMLAESRAVSVVPYLPPKSSFAARISSISSEDRLGSGGVFIMTRQRRLERWLQYLSHHPRLQRSKLLLRFLVLRDVAFEVDTGWLPPSDLTAEEGKGWGDVTASATAGLLRREIEARGSRSSDGLASALSRIEAIAAGEHALNQATLKFTQALWVAGSVSVKRSGDRGNIALPDAASARLQGLAHALELAGTPPLTGNDIGGGSLAYARSAWAEEMRFEMTQVLPALRRLCVALAAARTKSGAGSSTAGSNLAAASAATDATGGVSGDSSGGAAETAALGVESLVLQEWGVICAERSRVTPPLLVALARASAAAARTVGAQWAELLGGDASDPSQGSSLDRPPAGPPFHSRAGKGGTAFASGGSFAPPQHDRPPPPVAIVQTPLPMAPRGAAGAHAVEAFEEGGRKESRGDDSGGGNFPPCSSDRGDRREGEYEAQAAIDRGSNDLVQDDNGLAVPAQSKKPFSFRALFSKKHREKLAMEERTRADKNFSREQEREREQNARTSDVALRQGDCGPVDDALGGATTLVGNKAAFDAMNAAQERRLQSQLAREEAEAEERRVARERAVERRARAAAGGGSGSATAVNFGALGAHVGSGHASSAEAERLRRAHDLAAEDAAATATSQPHSAAMPSTGRRLRGRLAARERERILERSSAAAVPVPTTSAAIPDVGTPSVSSSSSTATAAGIQAVPVSATAAAAVPDLDFLRGVNRFAYAAAPKSVGFASAPPPSAPTSRSGPQPSAFAGATNQVPAHRPSWVQAQQAKAAAAVAAQEQAQAQVHAGIFQQQQARSSSAVRASSGQGPLFSPSTATAAAPSASLHPASPPSAASPSPLVSTTPSASDQASGQSASSPGENDDDDGWEEVHLEDGRMYYYHKITRSVRWEKPDAEVQKRLAARLRVEGEETERRRQERLAMLAATETARLEEATAADSLRGALQARVSAWQGKKAMSMLIRTLPELLPDLGPIVAGLSATPTPAEIKRCYLMAARSLHPDKTRDLPLEQRLLRELVFTALSATQNSV